MSQTTFLESFYQVLLSLLLLIQLVCLLPFSDCAILRNPSPSLQPAVVCHEDESSALLKLKQSFVIRKSASRDPFARPKTLSWGLNGYNKTNCCSWDGVECDKIAGNVIGIHLNSSMLFGSIDSTSTLFKLPHLRTLNLADNNFKCSSIPAEVHLLSELTSLNMSSSMFSGLIPSEITVLRDLVSFDLSNHDFERSLVTSQPLKILFGGCGLYGEVPRNFFFMPNLQYLSLAGNKKLSGNLPEFNKNNSLQVLMLQGTNFSGELPKSIVNLQSLTHINLKGCSFFGHLPTNIANLTKLTYLDLHSNMFFGEVPSLGSLSRLTHLSLSQNAFKIKTPSWLGMLSALTSLELGNCDLSDQIPCSISNLTRLTNLHLFENQLVGQIPSWLGNLTQLRELHLFNNQLHGTIPTSLYKLENLGAISLLNNSLRDAIDFDNFLNLKGLYFLSLSSNEFSISFGTNSTSNPSFLPKLLYLGLGNCNLTKIPDFLRYQDKMQMLRLMSNKIQGLIPEWFLNMGKESLNGLDLSENLITGFEGSSVLPWVNLLFLDLSYNMLQGSIPIPPKSTIMYDANNNKLTGENLAKICDSSSLVVFDCASNEMGRIIPPCLGNFSNFLVLLNLSSNNFDSIPQLFTSNRSQLKLLDLSRNKLRGEVPRSLENYKMLEILHLGNNFINGTFPHWLGSLPKLQVLLLRSNMFHGTIEMLENGLAFPELRIIDLSNNSFSGKLPSKYFSNWEGMKISSMEKMKYMQSDIDVVVGAFQRPKDYAYSVTITTKGTERLYQKISSIFVAIDLSSNKFEGSVPESIGEIVGLQFLNLSNNQFVGIIPPSLSNLKRLESLDLSQNRFSGEIPQKLALLNFLAFLNLSHNNLKGSIPRGTQFNTFQNESYEGNVNLCGNPLTKKCGDSEPTAPPLPEDDPEQEEKGLSFDGKFDSLFIAMGCGSGFVVGIVLGNLLDSECFIVERIQAIFGRMRYRRKRRQRMRTQRRRN